MSNVFEKINKDSPNQLFQLSTNMKFKDYLAEEEMKHKLYTKEEMREIKAQRKKEVDDSQSGTTTPDDDKTATDANTDDSSGTDSVIAEIKNALKEVTEDTKISTDGDIYIAKQDDKEYLGYFVYKKDLDEQDDFYVGKFIYRVSEQKLDSLIDDIEESFKNLADAEAYIKSYKGQKV